VRRQYQESGTLEGRKTQTHDRSALLTEIRHTSSGIGWRGSATQPRYAFLSDPPFECPGICLNARYAPRFIKNALKLRSLLKGIAAEEAGNA